MQKTIKLSLVSVALISSIHANETITLNPITVTSATKTSQSLQDVTSNINVITSQEIEEKNYTTVTEALNSLPGISFNSYGGLGKSTSVYVRGFDSKRVLVLIDGVRYNDITGLSGAPFEHLMIGDVEQIEVVKGAQSGIWGADATAGVINIITKSAKKGFHASVNAEYGSFNTKKAGISLSYKTDTYYAKISSQTIDTDGFSAKVPSGADVADFEDDGYTNTTTDIKFGVKFNDTNKIDISHTIINADNDYDGYASDPVASANSVETSSTKDTFTKVNFNHIDSFNELDIYVQKSVFSREYPQGWTKNYDGEVSEYGLKSQIRYNENDFLIVGVDHKKFEHNNDMNKEYNNQAVFLTNSNSFDGLISGKTILTESVRYDAYDEFDNKVTGKIGLKHFHGIVEGLVTSANFGTAYNVPTLYNLYDPTYGNSDLTAESTTSYDISAKYKSLQITYFNNTVSDMIDYFDPDGWSGPTPGAYYNLTGDTTLKGVEVEYSNEIVQDLLLTMSYTYLDAQNNDGETLARRAKDNYKVSFDYYGIENFYLGLNGEYVGERYNSDDDQGAQTGKYALVNLSTNYTISKNYLVYLKVDNLTDKEYQTVDGYATASRSGYLGFKANF